MVTTTKPASRRRPEAHPFFGAFRGVFVLWVLGGTLSGCRCEEEPRGDEAALDLPPAPSLSVAPRELLLPSDDSPAESATDAAAEPVRRCPPEMVEIQGRYCIDRYEVSLRDVAGGRLVSPYYHPTRKRTQQLLKRWLARGREVTTRLGQVLSVPPPPPFQLEEDFTIRAVSEVDVVPNGYLTRGAAEEACTNAGKRLCSEEEWVTACRGEADRDFPYGDHYEAGQCNIHREAHPAGLLHGDASRNHLDPRLPLVEAKDGRLLRHTGATTTCASRWGDDAVYDMVGNLDEWIHDPEGVFLGGFYSRGNDQGCAAKISSHRPDYFDYSLGTRCCAPLLDEASAQQLPGSPN